ncbi:MAG: outer membrane protein assembly factor BamC [Sodalis sp. (in: enterobacteria)]
MTCLIQNLKVTKVVATSFLLLLFTGGCTNDQCYKRQINGNDEYLQAPSLHKLTSPSDIILPSQNENYEILSIPHNGAVGKKLDIRIPRQP